MKVALVYDRINKLGGAERVLLALHQIWPDAPLYTSVYDKRATPWADIFEVRTSFLQKLPLPKNRHELYPYLMGLAFETFNFDDFQVVISVTHEFAKAVITKPKTLHICYCLNPTSYLWSGYHEYFSQKSPWFQSLSQPIISYLRWYDKIVANRPDQFVTISKVVQERIKKHYLRDSTVIYPPVNSVSSINAKYKMQNDKYFLVVSRLVPNKRVDITIDAFNRLGLPLKVIGTGILEKKLRSRAKKNVEFLGHLTDETLWGYYESCTALVESGEVDFGLVSVEAQSAGKPVIAYGAGGSVETVIPGKTGYFFPKHTAQSLVETIQKVHVEAINPDDCRQNAQRFSLERFTTEFRSFVEESYVAYERRHLLHYS